jgi:intracellular multiplication protein IcmL
VTHRPIVANKIVDVHLSPDTVPDDARASQHDAPELDAMLKQIGGRLHHTNDAVEPAVREIMNRKHLQFIAGGSVKLNFVLVGAVSLLVISNLYLGWHATHPDRQYFAADNGRIFPMIPMSQPYRKPSDVIQFAKDNVTRAFTMDFLNWRQQLEDVRPGYTRAGFKSFLDALKQSGVLDTVKEKRMNMSVSAGTGVLTKEGTENGTYQWIVELPIEVRLEGQTTRLPAQRFLTTVRIERITTLDSIEGIGVGQLVTTPL